MKKTFLILIIFLFFSCKPNKSFQVVSYKSAYHYNIKANVIIINDSLLYVKENTKSKMKYICVYKVNKYEGIKFYEIKEVLVPVEKIQTRINDLIINDNSILSSIKSRKLKKEINTRRKKYFFKFIKNRGEKYKKANISNYLFLWKKNKIKNDLLYRDSI